MKMKEEMNILIAEDDFLISQEIIGALKNLGYKIAGVAPNGKRAIEMTCNLKPDAILMDIRMPKLSGLEAAKEIQGICPTPIIVLTANESRELLLYASEIGIGAYLIKPPESTKLDRAITIACARHDDLMKLKQLSEKLEKRNQELESALAEINKLRGIIPICANCKKIRDDKGFWNRVEDYIETYIKDVKFSHGICPDCVEILYPEYSKRKREKKKFSQETPPKDM